MAILSFRENVRTKVAVSLFLIVVSVTAFLPLALVGDGTPAGMARMILLYPIGASFGVLVFASPWISAAAVADGVKRRTLQLARVKPIRMWQLMAGKWLGVMFLQALLLGAAFAISWAHVAACGMLRDEAVGLAKASVAPDLPSVEEQVDRILEASPDVRDMDARERRQLRATLLRCAPYSALTIHDKASFTFRPPRHLAAGETFWLRLKFISDKPASASCAVSRHTAGEAGTESLPFDVGDFPPQGVDTPLCFASQPPDGAPELRLDVTKSSPEEAPALLVQPRRGVSLLVKAGPLGANMLRAYATLLSTLALLSALGVALGSVFSLPVAVFSAVCAVIAAVSSDWVVRDGYVFDVDPEELHGVVSRVEYHVSLAVTGAMSFVSRSALDASPLSDLSSSEWIPRGTLTKALLSNFAAAPAILFAVFSVFLSRRELPE